MENVCRLCLQKEENMLNVVSLENEKLCSIIFDCFSIKITNNDALPKLLCTVCFGKLKSFNEFREKCKIFDCLLRAHYKMDFNYDDTLSKIKIYQNAQVQTDITSETLQMDYGYVFIKTEEITDENDFNTHYNNDDDRHIQDNNGFDNLRHSDDVVSNSADSQDTFKTSNKLKLKKKLKRSGINGSRKSDRLKNKDKILKCHFCLKEFLYIEEFLKHCRFHIIKESKKRGCKKRNANKENFTCQRLKRHKE
ncbi:PREDICTED: uncharacterized protein LOC107067693 isoform X2 [Polistes dominula]|uniref:Uncharacterized protein LOC107067693 isoform X2 n=1 Tax=Polistes dominula TaxID=743375 RepID=A0ABM1IFD1_POLDO|nr:PREDICTED: uncharacterized protein LOC107067693 isoform X2 [Polistes dominula]